MAELSASALDCRYHRADISVEVGFSAAADSVLDDKGRLDIVINIAGINPHASLLASTGDHTYGSGH